MYNQVADMMHNYGGFVFQPCTILTAGRAEGVGRIDPSN